MTLNSHTREEILRVRLTTNSPGKDDILGVALTLNAHVGGDILIIQLVGASSPVKPKGLYRVWKQLSIYLLVTRIKVVKREIHRNPQN